LACVRDEGHCEGHVFEGRSPVGDVVNLGVGEGDGILWTDEAADEEGRLTVVKAPKPLSETGRQKMPEDGLAIVEDDVVH